jgi:hypothetical protein
MVTRATSMEGRTTMPLATLVSTIALAMTMRLTHIAVIIRIRVIIRESG